MAIFYIRENETVTLPRAEKGEDFVILSPSLYWYTHARFPTRSLAKAKRLADAFMDSRPESYREIYVEKRGEGYDCYAYDPEVLRIRLEEEGASGLPCYFLQQFADEMPLRIGDDLIAEAVNGVCLEFRDSNRSLPELASLDFRAVAKPFNKGKSAGGVRRGVYLLLGFFAAAMLLDLGVRLQGYMALQKATENLRTDRSLYEIRAMVKRYETTAQKQAKLRREIARALKGHLKRLECTPEGGCKSE
ncbi:hypothetical protein [Hydrogenimonas sp. SS33]|uniref:hypothetical protein n=1 Tax=Hydrogenimonas leucolamina TaxID=2954236 RepID=UPI00336C1CD7